MKLFAYAFSINVAKPNPMKTESIYIQSGKGKKTFSSWCLLCYWVTLKIEIGTNTQNCSRSRKPQVHPGRPSVSRCSFPTCGKRNKKRKYKESFFPFPLSINHRTFWALKRVFIVVIVVLML